MRGKLGVEKNTSITASDMALQDKGASIITCNKDVPQLQNEDEGLEANEQEGEGPAVNEVGILDMSIELGKSQANCSHLSSDIVAAVNNVECGNVTLVKNVGGGNERKLDGILGFTHDMKQKNFTYNGLTYNCTKSV